MSYVYGALEDSILNGTPIEWKCGHRVPFKEFAKHAHECPHWKSFYLSAYGAAITELDGLNTHYQRVFKECQKLLEGVVDDSDPFMKGLYFSGDRIVDMIKELKKRRSHWE